ncbi:MAG: TfoX/Sxy family protein [Chloroflexi bacterium]|nr:TfoX/Sxy family protein [Chloroflexota bacterium]
MSMKMQKSPPELEKAFEDAFPNDLRAERRKMFGFPSGVVNGHMFGGLFERDVVLRLAAADLQTMINDYGAARFEPMGRPMTGYVIVPPPIVAEPPRLREWVQRAFECAAALPPKEKKPPKAAKAKKAR